MRSRAQLPLERETERPVEPKPPREVVELVPVRLGLGLDVLVREGLNAVETELDGRRVVELLRGRSLYPEREPQLHVPHERRLRHGSSAAARGASLSAGGVAAG